MKRRTSMRRRIVVLCIVLVLLLTAFGYGLIRMTQFSAQKWTPSIFQGLQAPFVENNALDGMAFLDIAPYTQPETVLAKDGWVYASVSGGILIRLREDGSGLEELLNTGTTIVGFDFDSHGNIIYCDGAYDKDGGAICMLPAEGAAYGTPRPLVTEVAGTRLMFPDAVTVASDGKIYFTDACQYSPALYHNDKMHAFNLDMMVHSNSGKVYVYDPTTGDAALVADGLCFANGLSLTSDGAHILVNETCEYRIWKIDASLRNASVGESGTEVILDNLPGFPDNMTAAGDGSYWVGLSGTRSDFIDSKAGRTAARNMILMLPQKTMDQMLHSNIPYAHVFRIDENGQVLENLMGKNTEYSLTTGATQTESRYYIHGLDTQSRIGWLPIDQ